MLFGDINKVYKIGTTLWKKIENYEFSFFQYNKYCLNIETISISQHVS